LLAFPGSRGVKLVADQLIKDAAAKQYDLIACPGGMPGAERLRDSSTLSQLVKQQQAAGKLYAAICATPAVFFESQGILDGRKATAHPAFSDKLSNQEAVQQRVVVDGQLTTSRGPGTAFEFALALVKQLYGEYPPADISSSKGRESYTWRNGDVQSVGCWARKGCKAAEHVSLAVASHDSKLFEHSRHVLVKHYKRLKLGSGKLQYMNELAELLQAWRFFTVWPLRSLLPCVVSR
jgi:4-methyl-5(b-hydroxyethyl)-thiazole monophosphate biosynthesis